MNKTLQFPSVDRLVLLAAVLLLQLSTAAFAQEEDSVDLQLFNHQDLNTDADRASKTIVSANRLAETPDEMAQEVIIIDGATIRKFGYSTLVDVLESIPGFRTSQPGNAIEGETFLMRGLYGNDHVKFLINGVPIKPEAVKGMPIGGQLPIRHAERIEIILGPSSALYGSESMAGVINIVLPEIDRPVFAWADVNLLSPNTTDFNLTLGGKAGKAKNIVNYEIFASSYRSTNVNLYIPDDSIRVKPGQLNATQQQLFVSEGDGLPEVDDLKRESRLLGTYLTYKGIELSLMNMYREENSGFGSQPLQQAYFDPSLTYGENINSLGLRYNSPATKRVQIRTSISALTYRTITNAGYYGVTHLLSNGRNFIYARSLDINGDFQGIVRANKYINVVFGVSGDYSTSHPFTNFLLHPYKDRTLSFELSDELDTLETAVLQSADIQSISMLDTVQFLEAFTKYDVSTFAQSSFKSKSGKWLGEAGLRVDFNSFGEVVPSPKLGVVYRPSSKFRLRAYYGKGYRAPKSYYIFNNYTESAQNFGNGEKLKRHKIDISSEQLQGIETGADWRVTDYWKVSLNYYAHYLQNRVLRQVFVPVQGSQNPQDRIGFGYFNGSSYSFLQSVMLVNNFSFRIQNVGMNFLVSYEYSKGKEHVDAPDDAPGGDVVSTGYRFVPVHAGKANLDVTYRDFTVSLRGTMTGTFITDIFKLNNGIMYSESGEPFFNLDLLFSKQLFRQLSLFGGVYNIFNKVQSGIPNVDLSHTWTYNPQYGRVFKLGLSFKLN
ncbi:MAG TPA: TonB-dependent receptor [Fluviicola sp.]|nr:TonB-dependent receptor [Fluviicola sp.]